MTDSADARVDRSFWLVDHEGVRHFPIRVPRKGVGGEPTFRISNAGNTLEAGRETISISEVIDQVVNHGFAVRVVPEHNPRQPPSLLKLNARKILTYGLASGGVTTLASYWSDLAAALGEPDAGWASSEKNWVRARSRGQAYLSCAFNTREGWTRIGIGLIGETVASRYEDLLARRGSLERAIGETLEWDSKEDRNKRQIFVKLLCDPNDRSEWPRQHAWLAARFPHFERLLADV